MTLDIKIVLFGQPAGGKTSLVNAFAGIVDDSYIPTGNCFSYRYSISVGYVLFNTTVSETQLDITINDTGGSEDFGSLRWRTYRGADVFILLYSVINEKSALSAIELFLKEIDSFKRTPLVMCGNRIDEISKYPYWYVSPKAVKKFMKKKRKIYGIFECSARDEMMKTGENEGKVRKVFEGAIKAAIVNNKNFNSNVTTGDKPKAKRGCYIL